MKKLIGSRILTRKIKDELAFIRKEYAFTIKQKSKNSFAEWLCDNYYIIEREGIEILRNLPKIKMLPTDDGMLPRLFEICMKICASNELPIENEIIKILENKAINASESELFELMLKCALINKAFEGCKIKGEKGTELFENSIKSIRKTADFDFENILESVNPVEKILLQDPLNQYQNMDSQGKCLYRKSISKEALKRGKGDEEVAFEALKTAQKGTTQRERHIGTYILKQSENFKRGRVAIAVEIIAPTVLSLISGIIFRKWYLPILLFFPIWEVIRYYIEAIFMHNIKSNELPALDLKLKVPANGLTLVTVSTLLPNAHNSENLKKHLMELWRSNGQENVKICILADLKGADIPVKPEDKADIAAAERIIGQLNKKFSGGFVLAIRPRSFSATQKNYTGWERKRGAITQLIRAIKGQEINFLSLVGDIERLQEVKYILALDSDTYLPMDTAAELVEVALHPLNKAVIDKELGRVTMGYGILAPNVNIAITPTSPTLFTSIMAGEGGMTAYSAYCCERYNDWFGESIFSGKGLIDVDAFYALLDDTLPEGRILSHDILEGGFLRVGFASNIQVADGFPKRQTSYYDRFERWIRGDWQNLIFIFGKNPLNRLSRYKLFDNLRRSITPVFVCAGLLLSLLMPWKIADFVIAICLLSAAGGDLFAAVRSLLFDGPSMFSRLYYSGSIPNSLASLLRCGTSVIMLAQTAWVCLSAICRAIFRSFISKKKLLEWTTAAQNEAKKKWYNTLLRLMPTIVTAGFLIAFGGALQRLLGVVLLLNIPFAFLSGRESENASKPLNYAQKERLLSYAAAMWQYYAELCDEGNNFLPPDNMQETPVFMVAQRTSPTNIGMMLMCVLAARDLGFIDSNEMLERLDKSIKSVEKLKKWEGNLLNWYDTSNLHPLEPQYVSTVDSGNFMCCIVALRQGLKEYIAENPSLEGIIDRISLLIDNCDLSPLYNTKRKLFYTGMDLKTGEPSPSYYDLLMSEARMTSYFAVAGRTVPKKHWGALGRMLAKSGRHTGPMSWTGTMFEYFMPNIFLPAPKGSLTYEALHFCIQCQRNRVKKVELKGKTIPWGISESGFYAFDRQFCYQYKAHGVQKLGLKRGLNSELVISPYSTFLTLSAEPDEALKNLKLLDRLDVSGRCGFYEAIDFTASRTSGQDFAVVKSYMAHHVGMSMLSILNVMDNNIVQKRFMSDENMASASCLLHEKIQSGAAVFKDVEVHEIPKTRERTEPFIKEFEKLTPLNPHMKIFTNREWSCGITDVGASVSLYRGVSILRHTGDLLKRQQGIFAFVRSENFVIPAVCALDYSSKASFKAEFMGRSARHDATLDNISLSMETSVHAHLPCEQRRFTIKNLKENESLKGDLIIYFEPSLAAQKDEEAHPAFSKIFLEDGFDENNLVALFWRRPKNGHQSLYLAVGFIEKFEFMFESNREKVLKCGLGLNSLLTTQAKFNFKRGNPDACAAFCIPIRIVPKENKEIRLVLYAATTKNEAINGVVRLREQRGIKKDEGAKEMFSGDGLESVVADTIIPQIFYKMKETKESTDAIVENEGGVSSLWSVGVSGDNPIIYIEIFNSEDVTRALPYVRLNKKLRSIGVFTDIILAFWEGGEYDRPIISAVREMLKNEGCENALNANGGVFVIDILQGDKKNISALMAAAVFIAPTTGERFEMPEPQFKPVEFRGAVPQKIDRKGDLFVKENYFADGEFVIPKMDSIPRVPWCLVLCNHTFGTMVSDKSLGFTWAINSRENKLTPWHNDTRLDNRGEMIILNIDDNFYDLVLNSAVVLAPDSASWYGEAQGMQFEVNVTVPERGAVKLCRVKIKNNSAQKVQAKLAYYCEPVLGPNSSLERFICADTSPKGIILTSSWSDLKGYCALDLMEGVDFFCFERAAFLCGNWQNKKTLPLSNPCAAVGKSIKLAQGEEAQYHFSLSWATSKSAAQELSILGVFDRQSSNSIKIFTPDKAINHFFNTWLPTQILKSRFFGRTGFYQCGGAWGFRDQLQDSSALIFTNPKLVRTHIIRCCAVQFVPGDVLHWWHRMPKRAGGLRGVRTRYSDDLLWLPFVTGEYIEKTQDVELLNVSIAYLEGEELSESEHERYFHPKMSEQKGSVYEHCMKAIEKSLCFGEHGLPLIGGGDWNDGFNKVGIEGKGESVWLAQFMLMVLQKALILCSKMNDDVRAEHFKKISQDIIGAIDKYAWNSDRYIRAFYDDGEPMGKSINANVGAECEIDSLTQSFATLANMPNIERREIALDTAVKELVDKKNRIIKLLAAPFSGNGRDAGYIASYPQGIRENGGQYTHAAVWLCMALIRAGRKDMGYDLLKMINPAEISQNSEASDSYRAEPYALAGDVSSAKGAQGRAGWSLYTGSAAWYYRAIAEEIIGMKQQGEKLYIIPHLPNEWKDIKIEILFNRAEIILEIFNIKDAKLVVDGKKADFIPLDGKSHYVTFK